MMVERIPMDPETVVSSGWLTNLVVMRVGLMVVRIPTDPEKVVSSGWLTNLGSLKAEMMAVWMYLVS